VETPYRREHVQQTCEHAEAQAQKKSTNDNDPAASIPEITVQKVEAENAKNLEERKSKHNAGVD